MSISRGSLFEMCIPLHIDEVLIGIGCLLDIGLIVILIVIFYIFINIVDIELHLSFIILSILSRFISNGFSEVSTKLILFKYNSVCNLFFLETG